MKRSIPLFIIDSSRAHGRARETDFVSCTSRECPWVDKITLLTEAELSIDRDWSEKNPLCAYTDPNPLGIRAKVKVVEYPITSDVAEIRSLLRRCLKEWTARRAAVTVDTENVSNEAIVKFCDILLEQTRENLRENPKDSQAYMVRSILAKIKKDYESNTPQ